MNIGLDWDDTYTADPEFWNGFIQRAQERGHRVTIVTARGPDWPVSPPPGVEVVYCRLRAKEQVVAERGLRIDVWIDDTPLAIVRGYI